MFSLFQKPKDLAGFKEKLASKLSTAIVGKLSKPKAIIVIPPEMSLTDAFSLLLDSGKLSAPVAQEDKPDGTGQYAGMLEVTALVSAVIRVFDTKKSGDVDIGEFVTEMAKGSNDQMDVYTPSYLAKINPMKTVEGSDSLLTVAQQMAKGTHRVAVLDGTHHVSQIISQSLVIERIHSVMGKVADDVTLQAIGITNKDVVTCSVDESVITAMKKIDSSKISALAVVDGDRLVGQISGKDLRPALKSRTVEKFEVSLKEFLSTSPQGGDAISVTLDMPLTAVFAKFRASKSHRMFLVDQIGGKLTGVVAFKDLLAALVSE